MARGDLQTLPTFFEHVTAIALLAFREANVELAILETGLGGRLDSTTAAGANIVAITQIAMDHQEYLGHSLTEIAAEKAAIIRSGVKAIVAPQTIEAMRVMSARCAEVGVTPCLVRADRCEKMKLGLRGRHQFVNAATAMALAEALREQGLKISQEAIVRGLEHTNYSGRLELWEGQPPILFDGAHNPAAARALRDYLDEFVSQPVIMIFGAMRDKALKEIAAILFPAAREVILTELDNPRSATIAQLRAAASAGSDQAQLHEAKSAEEALRVARKLAHADGLILVTGSLYLVGAARKSGLAHNQPAK